MRSIGLFRRRIPALRGIVLRKFRPSKGFQDKSERSLVGEGTKQPSFVRKQEGRGSPFVSFAANAPLVRTSAIESCNSFVWSFSFQKGEKLIPDGLLSLFAVYFGAIVPYTYINCYGVKGMSI